MRGRAHAHNTLFSHIFCSDIEKKPDHPDQASRTNDLRVDHRVDHP